MNHIIFFFFHSVTPYSSLLILYSSLPTPYSSLRSPYSVLFTPFGLRQLPPLTSILHTSNLVNSRQHRKRETHREIVLLYCTLLKKRQESSPTYPITYLTLSYSLIHSLSRTLQVFFLFLFFLCFFSFFRSFNYR